MIKIDTSKPVMVSGATGFVASWLVKRLLDEGLTVHAAVRNPSNKDKIAHLMALTENTKGKLLLFKSDLLEKGSYEKAMEGCELIFHTASPFTSRFKDPQKDLVDPAVKGTENVLETVNKTDSVKRVVLTSSVVAIYTDASECLQKPGGVLTEKDWNETASLNYQPYSLFKVLAEKKAWGMKEAQNRWDLVTINPSFVMGPALNPKTVTSESYNFLKQLGRGDLKSGGPRLSMCIVDVRDVAEAHFQAGFNPNAKGRYITSAYNSDLLEMAQQLLPKYGSQYPIPKKAIPKWLISLLGPFIDKRFTKRYVKNNVDVELKVDNSKIKKELGIQFRPFRETMEDSFQTLIDHNLIKRR